jgi:hypothetical protein
MREACDGAAATVVAGTPTVAAGGTVWMNMEFVGKEVMELKGGNEDSTDRVRGACTCGERWSSCLARRLTRL